MDLQNDKTIIIVRNRKASQKKRHCKKQKKNVQLQSNNNVLKSIKCLITNEKYNETHKLKIKSVVNGSFEVKSQRILPTCSRERCRNLHNIREKYCRPSQEYKKPKKHDRKNYNKIKSTISLSLSSLTNVDCKDNQDYEEIMSVERFSSDEELETLIRRARERDRKSTFSEQNQTATLNENTSYFDNISEDDNVTVFTSDMDISLHSKATLVLDPLCKDAYSPSESPVTFNFNGFFQTSNGSNFIFSTNNNCYEYYTSKEMFNDNLRDNIKQEVYSPSAGFLDQDKEFKNNCSVTFYQDESEGVSKLKTEVISSISDRLEPTKMSFDIKQEPLDIQL